MQIYVLTNTKSKHDINYIYYINYMLKLYIIKGSITNAPLTIYLHGLDWPRCLKI